MSTEFLDKMGLSYFWSRLKAWCNSLFVHLTGNETITGRKVFVDSDTQLKSSEIERTVDISGNPKYVGLSIRDKNSDLLGFFQYMRRDSGAADVKIGCLNPANTDVTDHRSIYVGYDENGIPFANAPSTSTSRLSGSDIVTRNWIPNDSRIVHSTGNENIAGVKTFTDSVVEIQSTVIQRAVSPSSGVQAMSLRFKDQDDKHLGFIQYITRDTGAVDIKMSCYKPTVADDFTGIYLGYDANGIAYANAPSTSASRNSGQDIVTRDWIPNDTRIIHATGDESLAGRKAFQQDVYHVQSAMKKGTIPNSNIWNSIIFADYGGGDATYAGNFLSFIQHGYLSDGTSTLRLCTIKNAVNSTSGSTVEVVYWSNDTGTFRPTGNNFLTLGSSGYRWKEIWCNQSSINSSSDERLKDDIVSVPDIVLDAWEEVDFKQFRFKDAVQEKEEKARVHSGLVAQHINNIFKKYGLDASKYGFFLYDEWDAEPEERGEDGSVVREAVPAGNSYGLRYVECLCIEAAFQRRESARLKKRVADLEERLAALELKVF